MPDPQTMLEQAQAPMAAQPSPPRPPEKVRVRVLGDYANIRIETSHTVGSANDVVVHLPSVALTKKCFAFLERRESTVPQLIARIGNAIPKKMWAEAIAAEIIARQAGGEDADIEMSAIAKGGYLALDHAIYKLSPVEYRPLNSAMSAIRRRISDKAHAEAQTITTRAHEQATAIMSEAASRLTTLQQREQELSARGDPPPTWTANYPVKRLNAGWAVGLLLAIRIEHWDWYMDTSLDNRPVRSHKSWPAIQQPAQRYLLWVPIAQELNVRSIYMDTAFPRLPHITHSGSCIALGDAPSVLDSSASLAQLFNSLARGHSRVQLNSLYSISNSWHSTVQAALPEAIRAAVAAHVVVGGPLLALRDIPSPNDRIEELTVTNSDTFNITL